jgi:hypothetical protein
MRHSHIHRKTINIYFILKNIVIAVKSSVKWYVKNELIKLIYYYFIEFKI